MNGESKNKLLEEAIALYEKERIFANRPVNKLLKEAIEIYQKSEMLKKNSLWISELIEKHCNKVEAEFDVMSWEEKEESCKKMDELQGRLLSEIKTLVKMDNEYRELARRVNKEYGKPLMEILPPIDLKKMLEGE